MTNEVYADTAAFALNHELLKVTVPQGSLIASQKTVFSCINEGKADQVASLVKNSQVIDQSELVTACPSLEMVPPAGLEPAAVTLGPCRSVH